MLQGSKTFSNKNWKKVDASVEESEWKQKLSNKKYKKASKD